MAGVDLQTALRLDVTVIAKGAPHGLAGEQEIDVFRIVQALTNAAKHARASRVDVTAEFNDGGLRVTVHDDGCGFEVPVSLGEFVKLGRHGLLGMQERAAAHSGSVTVHSAAGGGTTVVLEMPAG